MNQKSDNYMGQLLSPDVNFSQVRDGRRSPIFYYDVDLTSARSIAAGTHLVLPVAGDSFFVDKSPTLVGPATIHFQDTNFGLASAPVYCEPGAILNVPFTQLLVENTAQPGKVFRFFYGVSLDFTPGSSSSVSIVGNVSIVPPVLSATFQYDFSGTTGAQTLIAPASNPSGIILQTMTVFYQSPGAAATPAVSYRTSPPASNISSGTFAHTHMDAVGGSEFKSYALPAPLSIPAGNGLYLYLPPSASITCFASGAYQ